jgi:peptidoglycan/LPS O-acetylase OafA/YrhL
VNDESAAVPTRVARSVVLDLVRIFAALWVVGFHWSYLTSTLPEPVYEFLREGFLGVDIFFILSGAVIIHTAVGRDWSEFARSRFLRLFPVYVLASALVVGFLLLSGEAPPAAEDWLALIGLQFWTGGEPFIVAAWTLAYEVGFYVLVAVLILASPRGLTPARIRVASLIFLVAWLIASATSFAPLQFLTLGIFGPMFVLGVMLGISRDTALLRATLPVLIAAAALSFQSLLVRSSGLEWTDGRRLITAALIVLVVGALILWSSRHGQQSRLPGRVVAFVTVLSLMTYPIYLLHNEFGLGITGWLMSHGVAVWAAYAIGAGLVIAISWACVQFIEPWARGRIRALFHWQPRPRETAAPS